MIKTVSNSAYRAMLVSLIIPAGIGLVIIFAMISNYHMGVSFLFGGADTPEFLYPGYIMTLDDVTSIIDFDHDLTQFSEFIVEVGATIFMVVFLISCLPAKYLWFIERKFNQLVRWRTPDADVVLIPNQTVIDAKNIYSEKGLDFDEDSFKDEIKKLAHGRKIYRGIHSLGPVYVYAIRSQLFDQKSNDLKTYIMVGASLEKEEVIEGSRLLN